jgi:ubiquinol-cytochrome c reductase cytochrome c subunit
VRRLLTAWCLSVVAALALSGPASAQPVDAQRLYDRDCAWCHGGGGEGSARGPSLVGVGAASAHFWLSTGRMPIDEPEPATRGEPAYSEEEIDALVELVAGFDGGPEIPEVDVEGADLVRGGSLYRLYCAQCHGFSGFGGGLAFSRNAPDVWRVSATQAAEALLIGLPGMPVFGPETLTERERDDIVAYVTEVLQKPPDSGGHGLGRTGPVSEGIVAWLVGFGILFLVAILLGEHRPKGGDER